MATILIVDDETGVRQFLTTLVGHRGHRPVEAADGYQALSVFHSERPDLVISDIAMPALDGFEFVRQLRTSRVGKAVPVIIHTAYFIDDKARALAQECGVQIVLEKPSPSVMILEAVDKCLNFPHALIEQTALAEQFEREHCQLVTNKLMEKLREMERVNRRLEHEVAERKRSELALQASQARLASIVESATDAIISIDENQLIRLFNSAAEKMFHCRTVETLGQPIERFIPRFRATHEDQIRRCSQIGTADRRLGELGAVNGIRSDGDEFPIEASISQGNVGGRKLFTVILRDITDRKKAEVALRNTAERLRLVSRNVIEIQEKERRHLARELHDEFGQVLSAITLHLHAARALAGEAALPRLDECATLLQQAGEQVRGLALELRPTMLETLGLEATLRWLAEHHQQRSGCEVQVMGHLSGAPLSPEMAIACFRVAQEALTNVVRHAAARHVWIELRQSESVLELVVRDDGVGFDVIATQGEAVRHGHLGLLGMAERVQLLGGSLHVECEPGRGTCIRASFPLSKVSEQPADPEE